MKNFKILSSSALAVLALCVTSAPASSSENTANQIHGEYLESRSASVYAGPCHYSNEAVTAGKTATIAWRFQGGKWNNVALAGLNAVAVVAADANLATAGTSRRSVLYLDARATPAQTAAMRDLFTTKFKALLGQVLAVKATSVQVSNAGLDYRIRAGNYAGIDINRYPCRHCTQDAQIWYQPFAAASNVIVGKTTRSTFSDTTLGESWDDRQEANSAFVGNFSISG